MARIMPQSRACGRASFPSAGLALVGLLSLSGCGLAVVAQEDAAAAAAAAQAAQVPARLPDTLGRTDFGRRVVAAVRDHPALAGQGARIDAARADLAAVRAGARPQLSLGADVTAAIAGGATGAARLVPVLEGTQLLFDAGATRARLRAGREGILGEAIARESLAADLALRAVEAAHDLRHQTRLMRLAQGNVAVNEQLLDQIRTRVEAGAGGEGDRFSAESRLADARARLAAIRNDLDRATAVHAEVFGACAGPAGPVPPAPGLAQADAAAAIADSPRLRGIETRIEAAVATRDAVRASVWPALSLELGVSDPGGGVEGRAAVRPRGVIAGGGQRQAALARADAQIAELEAQRDSAAREVARALAFLRFDRDSGQQRLAAARAALAAQSAARDAVRDQFDAGRSDSADLLEAQRELFQAEVTLAEAERLLLLSGYAGLTLTGDILDVFGLRDALATREP